MVQHRVLDRRLVVLGALLIQLALGAIYSWSEFTPALKAEPYGFSATQTQAIFAVGLATFAVVMVLAGRLMEKIGPRRVALAGGLVLGAGYVLAGLFGSSFAAQLVGIGLVGGAGIGLAYVTPIAVGMRWYPDRKGMVTGLAVAGFGFGALGWIKLAGNWGGLLEGLSLFGLPGVQSVFLLYGLLFAAMVGLGSRVMVYPPDGWQPEGWTPPESATPARIGAADLGPREMLRTPQYYLLLTTFVFSSMAGLMTIGVIKLFGIDALQASGYEVARASAIAGTSMAVFFSLANGIGRIAWGSLSDLLGWRRSMVVMAAVQGLTMLAFYWMGSTPYLLYLGAAIIGFNFGGNFALFPVATADTFGTETVGRNYGWVFLAYGVGGIVGPLMAGMFRDVGAAQGAQAWLPAFVVSGVLCLAAAVIAGRIQRPRRPMRTAEPAPGRVLRKTA